MTCDDRRVCLLDMEEARFTRDVLSFPEPDESTVGIL
jgi:hypothetical protein